MRRVAVIQARMTSTRLPGKVMADLAGRTMLAQQLRRLKDCTGLDEIVVATTTNGCDDPVVELARTEGVACFRGSEQDVLSRYVGAAAEAGAELVVRITADCPLIDPGIVDRVVAEAVEARGKVDYVSNTIERTYPRGCDVEAFYCDVLERVDRLAHSAPAREHVTYLIVQESPELFVRRSVVDAENNSDLRWTVDTPEDLAMVREMYERLGLGRRRAPYAEMLRYVRDHPEVAEMNQGVGQKVV